MSRLDAELTILRCLLEEAKGGMIRLHDVVARLEGQ